VRIETLFLDAGGVLVYPNWTRISAALADRGVHVSASALAAAEPRAKQSIDLGATISATNDSQRGWLYFNLILDQAGVARSDATDAALRELHEYHERENLWELVPADVPLALERLRARGLRMVVVSNANGRLRHLFDRVGLTRHFDVLLDSFEERVEKPDPRLFEIALVRSQGRPEKTMHVGDLYHIDVVGARAAGLQATLLDVAGLYEGYDCTRIRALAELESIV
jgi:putative hydrolase of the HAD superfamily